MTIRLPFRPVKPKPWFYLSRPSRYLLRIAIESKDPSAPEDLQQSTSRGTMNYMIVPWSSRFCVSARIHGNG